MNDVYLLTGGNIGNRLSNLKQASELIENKIGTIFKRSHVYETAAWGITNQDSFLNQVMLVSTTLNAEDLLQSILSIEQQLGRRRFEKMGPRTIDIDILFYNHEIISTPNLSVPHPQIANRRFVLTPLNEIAPAFVHPVIKKTIRNLLEECPDQLDVKKYTSLDNN